MSNNLRAVAMISKPELLMNEGKTILVRFCSDEQRAVPMSEVNPQQVNMGDDVASKQSSEEEETVMAYDVYSVRVEQPISRDKVADAIIQSAYPVDKMQALINNHNLDKDEDEDYEEHLAEYNEMQQFRKLAKKVAKEVIAEYTELYC